MSMRMLVWVLLIGATCANAAPPKNAAAATAPTSTSPAAQDIDVDALARAKDVDANAADTNANTDAASSTNGEQPSPAPVATNEPAPATPAEQAAPAEAANQSPAPQAPPSGAPDARLAAACEARASRLLDEAQKGDYAAAVSDFDTTMRTALPAAKFKQAWESLAQFGALQARGQSHPATGDGYLVVTIPLIFEKANLYAQVACDSDGRIGGFYVKPLEMPGS